MHFWRLSSGLRDDNFSSAHAPPGRFVDHARQGKPVIPEAVAQVAMAVMGYDLMIVQAASAGNLELSQFLPLVADSILTETMLDLLGPRLRHVHPAVSLPASWPIASNACCTSTTARPR